MAVNEEYGVQEEEIEPTWGQKIATALWAPTATKLEAPQETLFTILLQPAPMKALSTWHFIADKLKILRRI